MENSAVEQQTSPGESGVSMDQEIGRLHAAVRAATEHLQQQVNIHATQPQIEDAGEAVLAAMMALYAMLLYRIDWQEERGVLTTIEAQHQRQLFQDQYLHDDGVLRKKIFG